MVLIEQDVEGSIDFGPNLKGSQSLKKLGLVDQQFDAYMSNNQGINNIVVTKLDLQSQCICETKSTVIEIFELKLKNEVCGRYCA
jgi:hypothetical protein